jgi:hypothetical protein
MRWLIAFPFILIGSILTATTVEDISYLGNNRVWDFSDCGFIPKK